MITVVHYCECGSGGDVECSGDRGPVTATIAMTLRASDGGGKVPRHRSWATACDVDLSEYSDDCWRPSFVDAEID